MKSTGQNSKTSDRPVKTFMPGWAGTRPVQTTKYRVLTAQNGVDTAIPAGAAARMSRSEGKGFKRTQKGVLRVFQTKRGVISAAHQRGVNGFFHHLPTSLNEEYVHRMHYLHTLETFVIVCQSD
jgi:hypothetical protein